MLASRIRFVALAVIALGIGSCVGKDTPTGVRGTVDVAIPILPALIPSAADAGAAPVTRIRAWAARTSDRVIVGEVEVEVDPAAEEWTIDLVVAAPADPGVEVRYWVLLMSGSGESEVVEFSGRSDPVTVVAGQVAEGLDIPILRGPLANHSVTGVTITSAPDSLGEGVGAALSAQVTSSDTTGATVFWTALDSAVVTVSDSTVTGVAPGIGRVVASAGRFADTTTVTVVPVPAAVLVAPDTVTVAAVGVQATFQAVVVDARGDTLPGGVVWSSGTPSILSSIGDGTFEGIAIGTGTVLASAASNPAVTGSATMTVAEGSIPGIDVAVEKLVNEPQPLADSTVIFTVRVINNGPDAATNLVVFDTLPTTPFTGVQTGVTTGTLDGDTLWTIPALAAGDTTTWTTTATVLSDAAGSAASNIAILRSLAENDTTPANDTARVDMNFPISAIPVVTISSPADGAVFDPGDLVTFTGAASDAEDGDLTPSIQWTSSVDGLIGTGRTFETSQLTTGVHTISASATDSDDGVGADTVAITIALITTPTTLNVPFGGSASLPITLSEPAQVGGVTLDVVSGDPSIATVDAASVFIAGGAQSANSTLAGIVPGQTNVTVSHPLFGASVTAVSVTAELNFVSGSVNVPATFPQSVDLNLESGGSPTAAPAGGVDVAMVSRDPACVSVAASTTIQSGLVSEPVTFSAATGGQFPCSAYVVATAPSIQPDSIFVSVQVPPQLSFGNIIPIGAGLQWGNAGLSLGTGGHGGVTIRIESSDPSRVLLAPDATTPGAPFIDRFVISGQSSTIYYIQTLGAAGDSVTITATGPGFLDGSSIVPIVEPGLQIIGLVANRTTLSVDDAFQVRTGSVNTTGTGLASIQAVRVGGDTVVATVTSTEPAVADLVTLPDSTSPVTVTIGPGSLTSAGSVATGGAALAAVSAGSTTVTATAPGFTTTDQASLDVTVTTPGISSFDRSVGAGLQRSSPYAVLGASAHGGVDVTITSRDPGTVLVSPDGSTAGTASIDVSVADASTIANYFVHGVEGQTGTVVVDISAPGFAPDSAIITVVTPTFDIVGLGTSTTSFSVDDPFWVRLGIPNGQATFLQEQQALRAGAAPLTIPVTSSNTQAADLVTLPDSASPVSVTIQPGAINSPTSVATGGVALSPVGAGVTTIAADIPGYELLPNSSIDVTVTAPGINLSARTVGAGLQDGAIISTLGASDHGGVTVRLESSDPALMLVTPNDSTPGTAFIDVPVVDGVTTFRYLVQGVEGTTGTAQLRVSAPGFVTDSATVTVVTPALDISGLGLSPTTFSPDDPFTARVGVPFGGNSGLSVVQDVRAGAPPLDVTISNSNSGVGQLETTSATGQTLVLQIPPGEWRTATTVAAGGVAFDALGIGTTDVSATAAGYIQTTGGVRTVTVSAPTISLTNETVGAGLQYGFRNAILGASNHGGVTVTLTSSNPSVMLLSPDATTAGTASIDIEVAAGSTLAQYYIQGVEGADASATVTATASGFTNGVSTVTVVPPGIQIESVASAYASDAPDDIIRARIGVPFANNSSIWITQGIRAGGTPATITFSSSNVGAVSLNSLTASGASVDVTLGVGAFLTGLTLEAAGVTLDPVGVGSSTLSVSSPGFTPTVAASFTTTINP